MKIFVFSRVIVGRFCNTRAYSTVNQLKGKLNNIKDVTENEHHNEVSDQPAGPIAKMDEEDTLVESCVKSKMTTQRTMYSDLLRDSMPEDEEAILEYYVRKAQDYMEANDDAEYFDVIESDKRLFFKMVDMWIQEAGEVKRGHREFVQVAMNNLNRFNVQHEPKAYLKILECYPQSKHTGLQRNEWFNAVWQDKILDHELGERLVSIMNKNQVQPNDEMYDVCTNLFGIYSRATAYIRTVLYWHPRMTAFLPFPISHNELEKMTNIEINVHALRQVNPNIDSTYKCFKVDPALLEEGDTLGTRKEHDCITSLQSDDQIQLLEKHDLSQPLFVEGPYMVYFKNHRVPYYIMRGDPVESKTEVVEHRILTDKEWWMKFYGKDFVTSKSFTKPQHQQLYFEDNFLPEVKLDKRMSKIEQKNNEIIQVVDDTNLVEGNVYAIASTNFKSMGVLRSWIKSLEPNNPNLSRLTIVFNQNSSFLSDGYQVGPTTGSVESEVV